MVALYVIIAFLVGVLIGLGLLRGFVMPKMEASHTAEMLRLANIAQEYGTCEECGARGPRYDHPVIRKRVCRDRVACLARQKIR